jgi:hypothetical protein
MKRLLIAILVFSLVIFASATSLPLNANDVAKEIVSLNLPNLGDAGRLVAENNLLQFIAKVNFTESQLSKLLETIKAEKELTKTYKDSVISTLQAKQNAILNGEFKQGEKRSISLVQTEMALKRQLLWVEFLQWLDNEQLDKLTNFAARDIKRNQKQHWQGISRPKRSLRKGQKITRPNRPPLTTKSPPPINAYPQKAEGN